MRIEAQKKTDINVLNTRTNSNRDNGQKIIDSLQKQKEHLFRLQQSEIKNFIPSENGDSSDAMSRSSEYSMKMVDLDMNTDKVELNISEQKDAKANRYLGKEVHYNGNGRKAIYSGEDPNARFSYNIRKDLLPAGHEKLIAHIVVKDKWGKQLYKATQDKDIKIGENKFVFTGKEEGAKKAFVGIEYNIEVELEYKINGKKEKCYEIADYSCEVVDTKDGELILSNRQKISVDEVQKHNKVKSEKEKREEENAVKLLWNDLLGKNVSFKDKDLKTGEFSFKSGKVISVHRDEITQKPDSVKVIIDNDSMDNDLREEKIIKIETIDSVGLGNNRDMSDGEGGVNKSTTSALIDEGRRYTALQIMTENDEFIHDGSETDLFLNDIGLYPDGREAKIVFYDNKNNKEIKTIDSLSKLPKQEDLTEDSWNKIKDMIKKTDPSRAEFNDVKCVELYNEAVRKEDEVVSELLRKVSYLIQTNDGKIYNGFKIKPEDLTKGEYYYKIFIKEDGKEEEERIDISPMIKGYTVDNGKNGEKVLFLQYQDPITRQERSITPDQIFSLGSAKVMRR